MSKASAPAQATGGIVVYPDPFRAPGYVVAEDHPRHYTFPNLTPADVPPAERVALEHWSRDRAADMAAAGYNVSPQDIAAAVLADPDSIDDVWTISPWWQSRTIYREHAGNVIDPRPYGAEREHYETVPPRKDHRPRSDGKVKTYRRMRLMRVGGRADRTADGRPLSDEMAPYGRMLPDNATAWDAYSVVRAMASRGHVEALSTGMRVTPVWRDEDGNVLSLSDALGTGGLTEDTQPGSYAYGIPRFIDHVSEGWRQRNLAPRKVTARHDRTCSSRVVDEGSCTCNYRVRTRKDGTVVHDHRPTCAGRGPCDCHLTWRVTERTQDLHGERVVIGRRAHRVGAPATEDVVSQYRRVLPAAERHGYTVGRHGIAPARKRGKGRTEQGHRHVTRTARSTRRTAALAAIDALTAWEGWTITVDTPANGRHAAVLSATRNGRTLTDTRRGLATALASLTA